MKALKICIVTIMILSGIAIILYPVINKRNTEKKQKEMIKQFKEEILKSQTGVTPVASDNSDGKNEEQQSQPDITSVELEEDDSNNEKVISSEGLSDQTVIGIIEIEKLDIAFAVVEGAARENIRYAIGHITGTSDIGQSGNCVLAGHRGGIYGQFFKHLDKLDNGDIVCLTDLSGKEYNYKVYDSFVVEPTDVYITDNIEGKDTLTMVTCENKGKQRLIVRAELIK
ncbi:MAG: class D sortase [Lachnospiraceae bacterium]|nr:class D sortase [Lachnospiraceae bacterium]